MRGRNSRRGQSLKTSGVESAGEGLTVLSCFEFGEQLLETNDLDPVYVLLWNSRLKLESPTILRWLLAYWCFYHVGTSSWICSKPSYWGAMRVAANSKRYPREAERRHFRGANAVTSVDYLSREGIAGLFDPLLQATTCRGVMKEVARWRGFGPWIGFKIADMLEALDLAPIAFSVEDVYLFDSPREGAERLRESLESDVSDSELNRWAVDTIKSKLSKKFPLAPPRYERGLGIQEAETVLCKWKSYLNGKYRVGQDIQHCRKALKVFQNPITKDLQLAGEKGGLW